MLLPDAGAILILQYLKRIRKQAKKVPSKRQKILLAS